MHVRPAGCYGHPVSLLGRRRQSGGIGSTAAGGGGVGGAVGAPGAGAAAAAGTVVLLPGEIKDGVRGLVYSCFFFS